MHFKAAIFDMDGLLLDSEKICMQCFLTACEDVGFVADKDVYISCIGSNKQRTKQLLIDGHRDMPYAQICQRWDALYADRAFNQLVPLKAGVKAFLKELSALGVPMGVATSTAYSTAKVKLENAGLLDYFDFVIGGDQVLKSKPHPQIYLNAAQKHNLGVHECVAFEDSENGVLAAHAAAISVIQIPDLVPTSAIVKDIAYQIAPSLQLLKAEDLFKI
ncbi:MAG: HAD family phosphatase [Oceanospirillaceae bacterium]